MRTRPATNGMLFVPNPGTMMFLKSIKTNADHVERDVERAVGKSLHTHWFLYLIEGLILIALGAVAVAIPPLVMVGISILLGWVFLTSGCVGLVTTFWMREGPGFGWSLLSAILGILVGIALFVMPIEGAFSITVVLVIFFVIEGVASILLALEHRRELSGKWEWMIASGAIDLMLGGLILYFLGSPTAWVMSGFLVGINMLFGGVALILMALHARKEAAVFDTEATAARVSEFATGAVKSDKIAQQNQALEKDFETVVPTPATRTEKVKSAFRTEAAETILDTNQIAARRRAAAIKLAERFSILSGWAGFIPLPFADLAAVGGLQLQMLRRLSQIYGVPFAVNRGKAVIASLAGSLIPATSVVGTFSMVKSVPAGGAIVGALVTPALFAGATYAIGLAFIHHFDSGGTLLNFNPTDYREFIKAQFTRARRL
jgi:uncharacterized membrane protein HdeD (DUF308 family)/uncharacterized protein (DUF697 family)